MNITAIVPSLNPDEKLPAVVDGLFAAGFGHVYVVNDGSKAETLPVLEALAGQPGVTVLHHPQNRGKGAALKTAFAAYLQAPGDSIGVVTVDADGQHSPQDAARVGDTLLQNPQALVLGVRDFSGEDVPTHNALGNRITSLVFKMVCGLPISDTQTGLRGISNQYAQHLLNTRGDRYEFETNMLLETKQQGVSILQVPISTIYINKNETSHFRPVADSLRIYLPILKFALSSLASSVVDLALFTLFNWMLGPLAIASRLLVATVGARVCSALFNFFVNHRLVFQSRSGVRPAMGRYLVLCVAQMLLSYGGVYLLSGIAPLPELPAKIIVDLLLFFVSYYVQKRWVFAARAPSSR